jgi:hypothetical protein
MKRRSLLARLLCPAVLALACVAPSTSSTLPGIAPVMQGEKAAAALKGETRLRKLHLVRPDLIPYPIAFEVYC